MDSLIVKIKDKQLKLKTDNARDIISLRLGGGAQQGNFIPDIFDENGKVRIKYFVLEIDDPEVYKKCVDGIQNKFDNMCKRELYSKFHNDNIPKEEQEKARLEYLDRAGVPDSFRWGNNSNCNQEKAIQAEDDRAL
ncbi:MAG: hypothetical protein NC429_07660 [Lachnospiraceae bacterium]|nr:hypothetical protein [Lachnospiraceae bacterium]